jgi:hypothetical protein
MQGLIKQFEFITAFKKKTAEAVFQTSGDNCNAEKIVASMCNHATTLFSMN